MIYRIKRFSFLDIFKNKKKEAYNKLRDPKEKLKFLQENFPEKTSSIHLDFLKLEKKIDNEDYLMVDYEGNIYIWGGDFEAIMQLEWSKEDGYWVDWNSDIRNPEIYQKDLKRYILRRLDKVGSDIANPGWKLDFDDLYREITKATWMK